jgi:hypothetical protein
MDLIAPRRHFEWNNQAWRGVLDIAARHGWEPAGTGPRRGTKRVDWAGGYLSNDGQLFYARDAKRLAAALEAFLERPRLSYRARGGADAWFHSPAGRTAVRTFIRFCRKGSFRIY